jgi:hypothetical protein
MVCLKAGGGEEEGEDDAEAGGGMAVMAGRVVGLRRKL